MRSIPLYHLKLLKNQGTEDKPHENSRFFAVGRTSVFEPSEACSSTGAATRYSSVVCCVTWICILNETMLVPAASGPAMPVLQAAWPCLSCWKTKAGCLADTSVLIPVHRLPSSKTGLGTSLGHKCVLFNTLRVHCIENISSSSRRFNSFLRKALTEVFTDCMVESQLTYLSISSYTGLYSIPVCLRKTEIKE